MTLQTVFPAQAALGECPLWAPEEGVLYWVDIEGWTLNRLNPENGDNRAMDMGEAIGCVGLRAAGGFVAGLRSGLWLLDHAGQKTRFIATLSQTRRSPVSTTDGWTRGDVSWPAPSTSRATAGPRVSGA